MNPIFAAFTAALLIWLLSASIGAVAENKQDCRPTTPDKVGVTYYNGECHVVPINWIKEGHRYGR